MGEKVGVFSMTNHTVESLRTFEDNVIKHFENGEIRGPVHLSRGNEEALIEIFKDISSEDWVFSTWRNHYHALLHGIPEEWLMKEILAGKSININNAEHHFYTSAIVGGIIPIALGVAKALQMRECSNKVWCFIGDMTYRTGIYAEANRYARNFNLPICFVVEDNNFSTNTPTDECWKLSRTILPENKVIKEGNVYYYQYTRHFPHVGIGKFVHF
jgi:pyruvate dehydrogenase E1 component alpha subunit